MELSKFEVNIIFEQDALLPVWKGNTLRSAFGARLREITCTGKNECRNCLIEDKCPYSYLFATRIPKNSAVLKKQENIARPFVLEAPNLRQTSFKKGEHAKFNFTLFGKGIEYFPYFLVAIRSMGTHGIGRGYRHGLGSFRIKNMKSVDELNNKEIIVYENDMVFNHELRISYSEILQNSEAYDGDLKLIFVTPTQIKKEDRYIIEPDFRSLMSRLLFRVNVLAEFHGNGMLYSKDEVREILKKCQEITLIDKKINAIDYMQRYSKQQKRMIRIPTFFVGELVYHGAFSKEMMALLELGRFTHVGKLATFGCGKYEVERVR